MAEEKTDDPKSSRKGHGLKKRSGAKRPERPAAGAELREDDPFHLTPEREYDHPSRLVRR
jgi:hypothetical protein